MVIQEEARPSGRDIGMKDVETEDLGSFESRGNLESKEVKMSSASHPGKGILVSNPI